MLTQKNEAYGTEPQQDEGDDLYEDQDQDDIQP